MLSVGLVILYAYYVFYLFSSAYKEEKDLKMQYLRQAKLQKDFKKVLK